MVTLRGSKALETGIWEGHGDHCHTAGIRRVDAAIAARDSCVANAFCSKRQWVWDVWNYKAPALLLQLPTCMPSKRFQRSKGKQDFLLGVGTRTQHILRGEAPHKEIAKEEGEEKVREVLTFSHPAVLLLVHEPQD